MQKVKQNPLAYNICTNMDLLNALKKNNQILDEILLCLEKYLESKRVVFPRFYFLSNDELIEIIAQGQNVRAIQSHMNKCFDAIWRIQFQNDDDEGNPLKTEINEEDNLSIDIISMISTEKEIVHFLSKVKAKGNVEFWLSRVEEQMIKTLRSLMFTAIGDYENHIREKWVLLHTTQVTI